MTTPTTPMSPSGKRESFFTPAIQDLCVSLFGPEDEHLQAITRDAAKLGFPAISISPMDGQVLRMLVTLAQAKHAVEIGTLAGYSALWIARALPSDGRLDCFELDTARAAFAREHIDAAAPPPKVFVHDGPALAKLATIPGPVDFVFIDADKEGYPTYLDWAAEHLRPGGMVALDNAFAWGGVADTAANATRSRDASAVRAALETLAHDERFVMAAMIPTNEGLAIAIRR